MKIFIISLMVTFLVINSLYSDDINKNQEILKLREFLMKEKIKIQPDEVLDYIKNNKKYIRDNKFIDQDLPQSGYENTVNIENVIESELCAAINPVDSNNIIISPIRQGDQPALFCPVYYTKDFGATWNKSSFITSPVHDNGFVMGGGDPVLTFDADGKAYLTWINLYVTLDSTQTAVDSLFVGVFWAYSEDGGATWKEDQNKVVGNLFSGSKFSQTNLNVPLFGDKQWIKADISNSSNKNNVYASATAIITQGNSSDVKINAYRKQAGNNSFDPDPVDVSKDVATTYQFSYLDVDKNGDVHIIFSGSAQGNVYLYHTISQDGGKTYSMPVKISQYYGTGIDAGPKEDAVGLNYDRLFPCPQFAADRSDGPNSGNLYIAWTANGISSNLGQGLDIYFSKSTDDGNTWSDPVIINDDDKDDNTENYYSSLAVNDDGVIVLTWYDRRDDPQNKYTHYYLAYSFDGGNTFTKNIPISTVSSDFGMIGAINNNFGIGEYNQTVVTKGYAIPVWADGRTNNGNINIYSAIVPISKDIVSVESIKPVEAPFSLNDLNPNPADESVSISFFLDKPTHVRLLMTDAGGRSIRELVNSDYNAGEHKFLVNLAEINTGEYFVRIETDFGYEVKKLIILK